MPPGKPESATSTAKDGDAFPSTSNSSSSECNISSRRSRRHILYTPEDDVWLSPLLCLIRKNIEAFAATPEDSEARARYGGRQAIINVGRVGIRCVHCADLPPSQRAHGAETYPKSIRSMHQSVRNWQRYHFLACGKIPPEVKEEFLGYPARSQSRKNSNEYWASCCERMGLFDADHGDGIRFKQAQKKIAQMQRHIEKMNSSMKALESTIVKPDSVSSETLHTSSTTMTTMTRESSQQSSAEDFGGSLHSYGEPSMNNAGSASMNLSATREVEMLEQEQQQQLHQQEQHNSPVSSSYLTPELVTNTMAQDFSGLPTPPMSCSGTPATACTDLDANSSSSSPIPMTDVTSPAGNASADAIDPVAMANKLNALMSKSQQSLKVLEEHDKKNGLPASHCMAMVKSGRSRRQLLEGRILKKLDGSPLIDFGESKEKGAGLSSIADSASSDTIDIDRGARSEQQEEKVDKVINTTVSFSEDGRVAAFRNSLGGDGDITPLLDENGPIDLHAGDPSASLVETVWWEALMAISLPSWMRMVPSTSTGGTPPRLSALTMFSTISTSPRKALLMRMTKIHRRRRQKRGIVAIRPSRKLVPLGTLRGVRSGTPPPGCHCRKQPGIG